MKNGRTTRSKKKMTVSLAVIAGFVPLGSGIYDYAKAGNYKGMAAYVVNGITGYSSGDQKFHVNGLTTGLLPIMAGIGVHKLASWLGINKALAASGLPFLRI